MKLYFYWLASKNIVRPVLTKWLEFEILSDLKSPDHKLYNDVQHVRVARCEGT